MKWILLLALLLPVCSWAQTDYSVGTLNVAGTGCTIGNTNDHVAIYTTGTGSATFTVQGTFVGTVSFFGSGDGGTSWGPLGVTPSAGGAVAQLTMGNGLWQANTAAYTHVCMMVTAFTSGTVFAKIHTSPISARSNGSGGGGGPTSVSLDAITSAVSSPPPLMNGGNMIGWLWQLTTGSAAALGIGESGPSSNGGSSGVINNQNLFQISTANTSTATPLGIIQGTVTSGFTIPALQISTVWNSTATQRALVIQTTCMACGGGSTALTVYNGTSNIFTINNTGGLNGVGWSLANTGMVHNNSIQGGSIITPKLTTQTNNVPLMVQGGIDANYAGVLGGVVYRGADNTSTAAAGAGGYAILRGGVMNTTSGIGAEGLTQVAQGFVPSTAANSFDVICPVNSYNWGVIDCPVGSTNIAGINTNPYTATGTLLIVTYGTVPVRITNTAVMGDTVCMSTTVVGQGTDSGGIAPCPAGTGIGIVVSVGGTVTMSTGIGAAPTAITQALSTSLPLVLLHIR